MGVYDRPKGVADFKQENWRKRPRKDARATRVGRLSIRVTPQEYREIKQFAEKFEQTIADYVICRALFRKKRVRHENDPRAR